MILAATSLGNPKTPPSRAGTAIDFNLWFSASVKLEYWIRMRIILGNIRISDTFSELSFFVIGATIPDRADNVDNVFRSKISSSGDDSSTDGD